MQNKQGGKIAEKIQYSRFWHSANFGQLADPLSKKRLIQISDDFSDSCLLSLPLVLAWRRWKVRKCLKRDAAHFVHPFPLPQFMALLAIISNAIYFQRKNGILINFL